MDFAVRVSGGRTLAVRDAGDPAGTPVLVQSGTPGSRYLYGPNIEDASLRGLRLISYDRPGYGGSAPQPGRSVADCAADVRAICAALGIERLGMWGISRGGPHVLACAALLPDLFAAAASLASPAPWGAEGLDYFAGMGEGQVSEFVQRYNSRAAEQARFRSHAEVSRFFAGLRLLEPGVVRIPDWRPSSPAESVSPANMWGGVAIKD
jgi:pimeloyl-ACP methyl ester carboxylesterase